MQFFYPKQVQRQLHKKKGCTERVIHGLKPPAAALRTPSALSKHVLKLRALGECQMQFMRALL